MVSVGPLLHARVSRGGAAVIALAIVAGLGVLGARLALRVPFTMNEIFIELRLLVPALAAAVAATTLVPLPLAGTLPRPAWTVHVGHVGVLVVAVLAVQLPTIAAVHAFDDRLAMLRNASGFLGLALLAAPIVGLRLAVVMPLGFALLTFLQGTDIVTGSAEVWAWPLASGIDLLAAALASALLVVGAMAYAVRGSRRQAASAAGDTANLT